MYIRMMVASLVLCACASTPKGKPGSSGGKASGGCKRVESDARKQIAAAGVTDVDMVYAQVAPLGRCLDPKGGWALTLDFVGVETVEYTDSADTSEEPPTLQANGIRASGSPAFVTKDHKIISGAFNDIATIDAIVDDAGHVVWPNFPYRPLTMEAWEHDWAGDGVPELVVAQVEGGAIAAAFDGAKVTSYFDGAGLDRVSAVEDFDGDKRPDLIDRDSLRMSIAGGDFDAGFGLALVAHARGDGTFSLDDAATRAYYAKACAGLGRSPWVRGDDIEPTQINVSCAHLYGVPAATINAGLDAEIAAQADPEEYAGVLYLDGIRGLLDHEGVRVGRDDGRVVQPVAGVTAVSFEPAFKTYQFAAAQAIDGDLGTSWQPKKGKSPWLTLRLASPVEVSAVEIANGFQRTDALGDLFLMNRRPTKVQIVIGKTTHEATLDPSKRDWQLVTLPAPLTTGEVKIVIVDSAEGSKWQNVAISEVRVLGAATP